MCKKEMNWHYSNLEPFYVDNALITVFKYYVFYAQQICTKQDQQIENIVSHKSATQH